MIDPLTHILNRTFVRGFYQAHAGMFIFGFLILAGAVEPAQLLSYQKILMLAFISSPLMLVVVFAIWLAYSLKTWLYVVAQIAAPAQRYLYYSSNAFFVKDQFKSWFKAQLLIMQPVNIYGVIAAAVGIAHQLYQVPVVIMVYLLLLNSVGPIIYINKIKRLSDDESQSLFIKISNHWQKPYFSLYIYYVINSLKVPYFVTKILSWLIVTGVFMLFSDVAHDGRVAGIAVLAIVTAHALLIFEERRFEDSYLTIVRNFPYSVKRRYGYSILTLLLLLLPECIWLFERFEWQLAISLLSMGLGIALLLRSLLYYLGLDMEKYVQWLMGIFILFFWIIMFRQIVGLTLMCFLISFLTYKKYYFRPVIATAKSK